MTDDHSHAPLNREQRRAQKFRSKQTSRQDNLQSQRANDTGFLSSPTDTVADAPKDVVEIDAAKGTPDVATDAAAESPAPAHETPGHDDRRPGGQPNS